MTASIRDPQIRAVLKQPFAQQVAFFRGKLGNLVPTEKWDDIWKSAHDRAFMVAGAQNADLLADLAAAVDRSISDGIGIGEFRKQFAQIVKKHGWDHSGERNWRTRVIYRTNAATSYAAGRLAQLREGGFPFWMYKHGGSADPRPQHLAWDGLVLPADHPFWSTHSPPNGWGCSCRVVGLRRKEDARRLGGDPDRALPDGWDSIDAATGEPVGVDRGWGYQPGATVADTVRQVAGTLTRVPAVVGAATARDWPWPAIGAHFGEFFDTAYAERARPQNRIMVIGAMRPAWVAAAERAGVTPESAEIAIRDRDIAHMLRDVKVRTGQALDAEWLRELPSHLRNPQAVLLDRTHTQPALLLVFESPETLKLVVRVNYKTKKDGVLNLIETGRRISREDLQAMLGEAIEVIDGNL